MKIYALLFAGACLTLVACGPKNTDTTTANVVTASAKKKSCNYNKAEAVTASAEGKTCNRANKAEAVTASAEGKSCNKAKVETVTASAEGETKCGHAGLKTAAVEGTQCSVTQAQLAEAKATCADTECPVKAATLAASE